MKKILLLWLLLLLAAWAPAAQAHGGLDPTFGDGGHVLRLSPPGNYGSLQTSLAPDGRIYALDGESLIAFGPDGELDTSFGTGGVVSLRQWVSFQRKVRLTVDSLGRPVLAGTVAVEQHEYINPGESRLALIRLLPSGELDPSFNHGEVLVTDLGLPPAAAPPGAPDYVHGGIELEVTAIGADPAGRIVVAGRRVTGYIPQKQSILERIYEGFAARIATDGTVDHGYGGDGTILGFATAGECLPLIAANGSLYVAAGGVIRHYDAEGIPDPSFGKGGIRRFPFAPVDMTVDGRDRLTLSRWVAGAAERDLIVTRLRPDGLPAKGFGTAGKLRIRFGPEPRWQADQGLIEGDRRGGLWVAADWELPQPPRSGPMGGLALAHVTPEGEIDHRFGRIRTGFGANTRTLLESLIVDGEGRPLLAGRVGGERGGSFALAMARYLR